VVAACSCLSLDELHSSSSKFFEFAFRASKV